MGAQQLALARLIRLEEEGVVHFPRRVLGREVESGEVVEVVLNVRPFRHGEAEFGEDGDHLVHHLQGRMDVALAAGRGRKRQVELFRRKARVELGGLQRGAAGGQRRLHRVAQGVELGAFGAALIGAHAPQRLEQEGDGPLFAEGGDAHHLERCDVRRGGDVGQKLDFERSGIGHDRGLRRGRPYRAGARRRAAGRRGWGLKNRGPRRAPSSR